MEATETEKTTMLKDNRPLRGISQRHIWSLIREQIQNWQIYDIYSGGGEMWNWLDDQDDQDIIGVQIESQIIEKQEKQYNDSGNN